jgi:c-di-GMP-binding flagellar brake protein YcgR
MDKRQCLRVGHQQQVRLRTDVGLELSAQSANLSLGGMEILCDQLTAKAIKPLGYQLAPDTPLLSISFCLSEGGKPLHATGCVRNMHRLAQESFSFNLAFTEYKQDDRKRLQRFIDEQAM